MTRSFLIRLGLPLAVLFGIALLLNARWQASGLFLNLATEIIGIMITVFYVEWLIRDHERRKWQSTDLRIANRLRILLNATVSSMRSGLGFDPEILDERALALGDLKDIHNEIMRVAEKVLYPRVHERVHDLDQKGWKSLATHLANAQSATTRFFNAFRERLDPDQIANLLDLEEALADSLTFYLVLPELAGVPAKDLPPTRIPPELLQRQGYDSTAIGLQKALVLVKNLSVSIPDNA